MSDDWNKLKHLVDLSAENTRLKAEVERLRKAGDAMVSHIRKGEEVLFECLDGDPVINEWNAAKEGKPSV